MDNQELFKTGLFDNLRKLITIIDELRDVGLQLIRLPARQRALGPAPLPEIQTRALPLSHQKTSQTQIS